MNSFKSELPVTTLVLSTEEKRSALDLVLESTTFLRSPQLRNFLRYIGDMEILGRASELNEYLIGVEALGRNDGYSTTDDSTVRRRAHALRQKLEHVYATELAEAKDRIVLPKGSYIPRFIRWTPETAQADSLEPAPPIAVSWYRNRNKIVTVALLAGILIGAALSASLLWMHFSPPKLDPTLASAWGFLHPGGNVTICLGSPPHYGILPYPEGPLPPGVPKLPEDAELVDWYRQHYPLQPGEHLQTHLTTGPIRLGEVRGLVSVIRTLDRVGVNYDVIPEKDISVPALRGHNLVVFANPEFSFVASTLLDNAALTVAYDPLARERVIREQRPGSRPGRVFVPTRGSQHELVEVFGLITVIPSQGPGNFRSVIFSCTNSAGCEAASEFFCSAQKMAELRERLRKDGFAQFPPTYQVVIRSKVHNAQAVTGDYEAYYVPRS